LIGAKNFRDRRVGVESYWRLGEENALTLRSQDGRSRTFYADQAYRIIESEPEYPSAGQFRVTTLMYSYELVVDRTSVWQMHWHPDGQSHEWRPHYHLSCGDLCGDHLPSGRHTIEDAVEWCIRFGAFPAVDEREWHGVLAASKARHERYRGWAGTPGSVE
jgi:hypothetical protein